MAPVSRSSWTPHFRVADPPPVLLPQPRHVVVRASGKPMLVLSWTRTLEQTLEDGEGDRIGGNHLVDTGQQYLLEQIGGGGGKALVDGLRRDIHPKVVGHHPEGARRAAQPWRLGGRASRRRAFGRGCWASIWPGQAV